MNSPPTARSQRIKNPQRFGNNSKLASNGSLAKTISKKGDSVNQEQEWQGVARNVAQN
jgi:hypothetical protein